MIWYDRSKTVVVSTISNNKTECCTLGTNIHNYGRSFNIQRFVINKNTITSIIPNANVTYFCQLKNGTFRLMAYLWVKLCEEVCTCKQDAMVRTSARTVSPSCALYLSYWYRIMIINWIIFYDVLFYT